MMDFDELVVSPAQAEMPKSTKMLMAVYFAIVCAMAAAVVLDRPSMRHYELYELIRSAFMFGWIGFLSVWLTLSPGQRRRKFGYLAAVVLVLSGLELFSTSRGSAEDVVWILRVQRTGRRDSAGGRLLSGEGVRHSAA
jgi:hypothetical protein